MKPYNKYFIKLYFVGHIKEISFHLLYDFQNIHYHFAKKETKSLRSDVYLWRIHVDIWQNQYNIVKFKKKKKNLIPRYSSKKQFLIFNELISFLINLFFIEG